MTAENTNRVATFASLANVSPRTVTRALGYLLAAVCFVWVVRNIDLHLLLQQVRVIRWEWLSLAIAFDVLSYICQGWRWRLLLEPVGNASLLETTQAVYVGLFTNEIMPLRVGEAVRAYLMSRKLSSPVVRIVPSMTVERLFDAVWVMVGVVLTALFVPLPRNLVAAADVLTGFVFAGLIVFSWFVIREKISSELSDQPPQLRVGNRFSRLRLHLVQGLREIATGRSSLCAFFISSLVLSFQGVAYWLVMRGYGLKVSLWAGAAVFVIVYLGTAIPNTPANVGTYQFFTVVGLSLFGVEKTLASGFSVIVFIVLTLPLWALGFLALLRAGATLGELRTAAREIDSGEMGLDIGPASRGVSWGLTGRMLNERQNYLLLSVLVLAGIAAVAYADHVVVTISLAYLYVLPLALSALIYRLRYAIPLCALCVLLHDIFGPFTETPLIRLTRNLLTLIGFLAVVLVVNRLNAQKAALAAVVRAQRDALETEISMAARVQQRLLPQFAPRLPGFDIAGRMYPARVVGGDYFDFIEMPLGSIGIAIADVAGKGVAAAVLMPAIETTLRVTADAVYSTSAIAGKLNELLYKVTDEERYATMFFAVLDPSSRTFQYTNAGHPPPLLLRATPHDSLWLNDGDTVVGLLPDAAYETHLHFLQATEVVVLYTDGVIEAENAAAEQYSSCRLEAVVKEWRDHSADEIVSAIYDSVVAFTGTKTLSDDLTVVVIRVLEGAHS
jgi:uncharacterized protein (TIRG00374 family)